MTKKDYELVAKVLNVQITRLHESETLDGDTRTDRVHELQILADKLANEFKADNRKFDYDKFLNQAGVLNNPFDPESSNYIA